MLVSLGYALALYTDATRGYFTRGVGWYAKRFRLPSAWAARSTLMLRFEGVLNSADGDARPRLSAQRCEYCTLPRGHLLHSHVHAVHTMRVNVRPSAHTHVVTSRSTHCCAH